MDYEKMRTLNKKLAFDDECEQLFGMMPETVNTHGDYSVARWSLGAGQSIKDITSTSGRTIDGPCTVRAIQYADGGWEIAVGVSERD